MNRVSQQVRISSELKKTISDIQKQIEQQTGCKVCFTDASRVLATSNNSRKFRMRIGRKKQIVEVIMS